MEKNNLCIIFGGQSSEHEVSCVSASNVIENIDNSKYNIYKVGIGKDGKWQLCNCSVSEIKDGTWVNHPLNKRAFISPDASVHGLVVLDENGYQTIHIDIAFGVLHGLYGEDGTVQGLFELARIAYVGPGVASSAICMDKAFAKIIAGASGIPQAKWTYFSKLEFESNANGIISKIESMFSYPIFIKPANAGSSVGITKAHDKSELIKGINEAARHDFKIVIEENIDGREIECAVMGNEAPIASVCGEIIPAKEFYDYDAKYNDASSRTIIPIDIDKDIHDNIRQLAVKLYKLFDCRGLARIDFFYSAHRGILLNEINTIPGFTSISMYPKMFEASGIPYSVVIDRLIEYAKSSSNIG